MALVSLPVGIREEIEFSFHSTFSSSIPTKPVLMENFLFRDKEDSSFLLPASSSFKVLQIQVITAIKNVGDITDIAGGKLVYQILPTNSVEKDTFSFISNLKKFDDGSYFSYFCRDLDVPIEIPPLFCCDFKLKFPYGFTANMTINVMLSGKLRRSVK